MFVPRSLLFATVQPQDGALQDFDVLPLFSPLLLSQAFGLEVTEFRLINAATDEDLGRLDDGAVVNINGYNSLSVEAITSPASVGSVRFDLDGTTNSQTENVAPYALHGDSQGNFAAEPALQDPGTHTIAATPFPLANREGSAGTPLTIEIEIVDWTEPVPTVSPQPTPAPAPLPVADTDVEPYQASADGTLNGELKVWHKITIGFRGPSSSETDNPNPFTYYRLDVTFTSDTSGAVFVVPGYFAADGNAANSGATSGNVWLAHFAPSETGTWQWIASFKKGNNVAQNGGSDTAGFFDGANGDF